MTEGTFDFVIIGAGASGEATAHYARARKASVAIVDRTVNAFPTTSRALGGLFASAALKVR